MARRNNILKRVSFWKTIRYGLMYTLIVISVIALTTVVYKSKQFGDANIEEIIFYMTNGLAAGQTDGFGTMILDNLLLAAILLFLLSLPVLDLFRNRIILHFNFSIFGGRKKREFRFNPSQIRFRYKFIYSIALFCVSGWLLLSSFGVPSYIASYFQTTTIYEDNYTEPRDVSLEFPAKKRNLIYIFLESMENTIASRDNGGQATVSQIPELEKLATDPNNINFSNRDTALGGALPASNTTWTVAAMTAQSAGVPLVSQFLGEKGNNMGKLKQFLPGAYTLGNVLQDAGYNQTFIMGSDEEFGGRDKLLLQHGDYNIIDLNAAHDRGLIPKDYKVWWGYEDSKLFEYAKNEATRLSKSDKPFNLQMLTVNTHFVDGYLEPTCSTPFDNQYANVWDCSSSQVAAFIKWVQSQPFADNTTIVISGDHLGMQTDYYNQMITAPNYQRTIYNVFINSAIKPVTDRDRLFSTMDMYPSTLAAMGVKIDGDKMGLGVNLFSDKKTLVEQYGGIDQLNAELSKRSPYYEERIMVGR